MKFCHVYVQSIPHVLANKQDTPYFVVWISGNVIPARTITLNTTELPKLLTLSNWLYITLFEAYIQNAGLFYYCSGFMFSKIILSLMLLSFCVLAFLSQKIVIAFKNCERI